MRLVVSRLKVEVLILKLVEVAALFVHFLLDGLVAVCNGFLHRLAEVFKVGVEGLAAFTLPCLSLQYHGLRELPAYLYDGVEAGHGVLEYHCYLVAADLVKLFF